MCPRFFFTSFGRPRHWGYQKYRKNTRALEARTMRKPAFYTPRLIITARSTVEVYSEGYAWARTSENVRGREGAGIVMGSIEEKIRFEYLPLN